MKKFLALAMIMLAACTSSSNEDDLEKERAARLERELQEIVRQQEADKNQALHHNDVEEVVEQEPEAPAEPQYEETEYYMFTSMTEKTPIQCLESEETACGLTFKGCKNDNRYYCQTNVKYYFKTEKTLVQ